MNNQIGYVLRALLLSSLLFSCGGSETNSSGSERTPQLSETPPVATPPVTTPPVSLTAEPLFENSIVSTEIDFITIEDPTGYVGFDYLGQHLRELVIKISGNNQIVNDKNTFVYIMNFSDSNSIEAWLSSDFGTKEKADQYFEKLAPRLGKTPAFMRNKIDHVVVNDANHGAFAEQAGHFFVLSSQNMDIRISNNDLEETIFHESVHAAIDHDRSDDPAWLETLKTDAFITRYGKNRMSEDMAESAIFVFTMKYHPGRLGDDLEKWIKTNTPNKYDYLYVLF